MSLSVIAIDIGIVNLGYAQGSIDTDTWTLTLEAIQKVDITDFSCMHDDSNIECELNHERCSADWVGHFVQQFYYELEAADHIFIERQPPGGHRDIEQLLYMILPRAKTKLVHPASILSFCGTRLMEYEERKEYVVHLASKHIDTERFPLFACMERKHDIADAVIMLLMFAAANQRKAKEHKPVPVPENVMEWMESMRFGGPGTIIES